MNLIRQADTRPDRTAIRLDDVVLSYAQLEDATRKVAGLLAERGVQPGDRVAVMLPNVPQFAVLYYGILRMGGVVVPMNPLLKDREIAYYLGNSGAKLIFTAEGCRAEAEAGAKQADAEVVVVQAAGFAALLAAVTPVQGVTERAGTETAVILYTSGTTGQPKGAELTHANLARNAEVCVDELFGLTAEDMVFGGLPLFHVFGQTCGLNAVIAAGATLTLLPRFDAAKALEILVRDRATIFEAVPTMYMALLNHPGLAEHDLSALRICVSGGSAMPIEVMTAFEQATGATVLEGYGLSETSPAASFNLPSHRRAGSIGTPISGVEFRLVDEQGADVGPGEIGEIAVLGHNVMRGYWGKPEETAKAVRDGWFHTGDLARRDDDGFYFIVDRKKDMIIRGGYNVYPREIEEVLYGHPAVAEAAVIGVPHAELGEEIAAAVTLKPGAVATPDELREHAKSNVAAYKYPRLVHVLESLPKTATGKILKREIKLG
ncbi:long-chain fatty acid--CoA ligase [Arthrobacter sp. ISL-69]|uniref:long-chain-fatty-acid--CoA ligase n=1 Tax=Arthrobacter sp. ISL-69 TaxID=2819113 RepID=UPI001BEC4DBC|nr:long-chain fatty acid--CoA ligase [Arthrobacter sp. ISL-69]MBT2539007.1 long-chain fatty acid--CoA ligase [Arthrobacter sp. ISL-69]